MIDLVDSFNNAFRLQQEGRLVEAETLYRAVLDVAPEHPGSHHLLGLVEHQLGRHEAALTSIKRAIEFNGSEPNYHNNLGTVYRTIGKVDEAIACYRHAVGLRPDFAAAFNNLGIAFLQKGEFAQAQRALERALEAKPNYVALGPIYPTRLKKMAFAPQGLDRIGEWKRKIGAIPLVAIGGITLERARGALSAGADSAAVVTDITLNADPEQRTRDWAQATRP